MDQYQQVTPAEVGWAAAQQTAGADAVAVAGEQVGRVAPGALPGPPPWPPLPPGPPPCERRQLTWREIGDLALRQYAPEALSLDSRPAPDPDAQRLCDDEDVSGEDAWAAAADGDADIDDAGIDEFLTGAEAAGLRAEAHAKWPLSFDPLAPLPEPEEEEDYDDYGDAAADHDHDDHEAEAAQLSRAAQEAAAAAARARKALFEAEATQSALASQADTINEAVPPRPCKGVSRSRDFAVQLHCLLNSQSSYKLPRLRQLIKKIIKSNKDDGATLDLANKLMTSRDKEIQMFATEHKDLFVYFGGNAKTGKKPHLKAKQKKAAAPTVTSPAVRSARDAVVAANLVQREAEEALHANDILKGLDARQAALVAWDYLHRHWREKTKKEKKKAKKEVMAKGISHSQAAAMRDYIAQVHGGAMQTAGLAMSGFYKTYPALYLPWVCHKGKAIAEAYPQLLVWGRIKTSNTLFSVGEAGSCYAEPKYALPANFKLPCDFLLSEDVKDMILDENFLAKRKAERDDRLAKRKAERELQGCVKRPKVEKGVPRTYSGGAALFWRTVLSWEPSDMRTVRTVSGAAAPALAPPPVSGRYGSVTAWADSCRALAVAEAHVELAEAMPKFDPQEGHTVLQLEVKCVLRGKSMGIIKLVYDSEKPVLHPDALRPSSAFLLVPAKLKPDGSQAMYFASSIPLTSPGSMGLQVSTQTAAEISDFSIMGLVWLRDVRLLGNQRMAAAGFACLSEKGGMMRRVLASALAGVAGSTHTRFGDDEDEGGAMAESEAEAQAEAQVAAEPDTNPERSLGAIEANAALARARAFVLGRLNSSQRGALARFRSLFTPDGGPLQIVHGPPGCGKTVFLVAALLSTPPDHKVLCSAPSNAAVVGALKRYQEACAKGGLNPGAVVVGDAEALGVKGVSSNTCAVARAYAPNVVKDALNELRKHRRSIASSTSSKIAAGVRAACSLLPPSARKRLKTKSGDILSRFDDLGRSLLEQRASIDDICTQIEAQSQSIVAEVVSGARVVFSTLSAAGSKPVRQAAPFDLLLVDEAAQATEPAILLGAAVSRAPRCALVGDPRQLPATIKGAEALRVGLDRSLVARLMDDAGVEAELLDEQYRMHPAISSLPRQLFYGGQLRDAACVKGRPPPFRPGASLPLALARRYAIVDVARGSEKFETSGSVSNEAEAELVQRLASTLAQLHGLTCPGGVAIITPYAAQARLIGNGARTVDSWQGGEADGTWFKLVSPQNLLEFGTTCLIMRVSPRSSSAVHLTDDTKCYRSDLWALPLPQTKTYDGFAAPCKYCRARGPFGWMNLTL